MQVCSYTYECEQFNFDFAPKKSTKLYQLYHDKGLYSFFPVPKSEKFSIKIHYPQTSYQADIQKIRTLLWLKFSIVTLLLFILALFFTFYSLKPIRKALKLNDEFIRDILHDFNTPITSMLLNIKMFQKEKGDDANIKRVSHSIDTILLLQNNLKTFLHHSPTHSEHIDITRLLQERLNYIKNIYPKLEFHLNKHNDLHKTTHKDALIRILDNILSNAAKYNKHKGSVIATIQGETISIKDTGKGIKNIHKVQERYYKEQARGLGLGLHIVQKLSDELDIMINISSIVEVGTEVTLDFQKVPS